LSSNSINLSKKHISESKGILGQNVLSGTGKSLQKLNTERDELFVKVVGNDFKYIGFDASKFGVQNILESKRNETSSTTPIQLLSNYLQSIPTQELKSDVIDLLDTYSKAVELYSINKLTWNTVKASRGYF